MRIVAARRRHLGATLAGLLLLLGSSAEAQSSLDANAVVPSRAAAAAGTEGRATTPPAAGGAATTLPPHKPRVAIRELQVEGEETSPALGMQLQDGFVVGFVRAGIEVLDSVDVARRIEGHPELQKCDTPICLKRLGQVLDVRYLLLLKVAVTGNSYRMTARLFGTEGGTPAVLPVDTQSRFCDVCTVAEAREVMLRLADSIKRPIEDALAAAAPPPPPPAPKPSMGPALGLAIGAAAIVGGTLLVFAANRDGRAVPAVGGALVGAGLTVVGLSFHAIATDPGRSRKPVVGIAVAGRF